MIADDYESIRTRMEEIAAERLHRVLEVPIENQEVDRPQTYMGWDIYAPFSPAG